MPTKQNKALVRRFLEEVYNRGNLDVADELVAPDYVSHNELNIEVLGPRAIAAIKDALRAQGKSLAKGK